MNNPDTPDSENLPDESTPVAPSFDVKRRLRELLSVPERDRTDEQWDEIIELEIQTAPGNRISGNEQGGGPGRGQPMHGKPGGGQQKKHRPRQNNNNRRPRPNKPQGGGGGSGGAPA